MVGAESVQKTKLFFWWYYHCFCITNSRAAIAWPETDDDICVLKSQYAAVIGACHPLVYSGVPIGPEVEVTDDEGYRICNWGYWRDYTDTQIAEITDTEAQKKIGRFNHFITGSIEEQEIRTLLGHLGYGSYVFVNIQTPMTLADAAQMMADLGCDYAVNMGRDVETAEAGWDSADLTCQSIGPSICVCSRPIHKMEDILKTAFPQTQAVSARSTSTIASDMSADAGGAMSMAYTYNCETCYYYWNGECQCGGCVYSDYYYDDFDYDYDDYNYGDEIIFGSDAKSIEKLMNQMVQRGWTEASIRSVVSNPYTTRVSTNLATGNPATVFYHQEGAYVIVDDIIKCITDAEMIDIRELLTDLKKATISNGTYYNMYEFYKKLNALNDELTLVDMIITPYYIDGGRILEIYDYELSIRLVDNVDIERSLLKKTGRNNITHIDKIVLDKLINCYIELDKSDQKILLGKLMRYIKYTIESDELKERIEKIFNSFDIDKIYFSLY